MYKVCGTQTAINKRKGRKLRMNEFFPHLFEPWKIGNCEIPNRIVLTPMLMEVAELDGTAGDRAVAYYTERAKGGTGLIQTEVTRISDWTGCTGPRQLSVYKRGRHYRG